MRTRWKKIRFLTKYAYNAPVVLLVCADERKAWHSRHDFGFSSGQMDASIVCTHMMLEAWEQGIGSCWVNYFPVTQTADAFGLELNEVPLLLLPIGYAAEGTKPAHLHTERRSNEELVKVLIREKGGAARPVQHPRSHEPHSGSVSGLESRAE